MKHPKIRRIAFLSLCIVLLCATVFAGGKKSVAIKHFKQAQVHYKLGQFEGALGEFTKAFEALPKAGFLFNIGQCHRQLEDFEKAVYFYEGYLRQKPNAKNRAVVIELIAECKRKFKQQEEEVRREEELERREEEARQQEEERKKLELERRIAEEKSRRESAEEAVTLMAMMPPENPPVLKKPTPFYKTWWFWTIVGCATAAVAGGTIYAVSSGGERIVLPAGELGTFDRRGL